MTQYSDLPIWTDALEVRKFLIVDGWNSPDTYDNCFESLSDGSAVYLFQLYRRRDYKTAIVAYVGMSTKLSQRLASHNLLPKLATPKIWPMRWFKLTPAQNLREVERKYIAHFNPPWNIIGRRCGIELS